MIFPDQQTQQITLELQQLRDTTTHSAPSSSPPQSLRAPPPASCPLDNGSPTSTEVGITPASPQDVP